MKKINFKKILMTLMSMLILTSNINISVFGIPPSEEAYLLFEEIRDNKGYIMVLNAWSNFIFGCNVVASVCPCSNACNNKEEFTCAVVKALELFREKPNRALEPSDVNWYFFRMMAPYMQRVFDLIIYSGNTMRILETILNSTCSHRPPPYSEKFIQTTENHFRDLYEMLDGLDFHELLKLKEYMGRLERQIDDHLCSYVV